MINTYIGLLGIYIVKNFMQVVLDVYLAKLR